MKVRGERKCTACGTRWSYYETGEITCPSCGSPRSIGVDERTEHTASPEILDLTPVRDGVDEKPVERLCEMAVEQTREYLKSAGFVHAGSLEPLTDTFLAASELRRVGTTLGRVMQVSDTETLYFYELLKGADEGERPPPEEVPERLRPERGLAVASSIELYVRDIRRSTDSPDAAVETVLSALRARRKRIEALDGDIDPAAAERLVDTVRELSVYLRDDDETALTRAQQLTEEL